MPGSQRTSHKVAESLKKIDEMISEVRQIKDQCAILIEQTSANVPTLNHIDQASTQTSSGTAQTLQSVQKSSSRIMHVGTGTAFSHMRAENTVFGVCKFPFDLEKSVQIHVSSKSNRNMTNLCSQSLQADGSMDSVATDLSIEGEYSSLAVPRVRDLDKLRQELRMTLTKTLSREINNEIDTQHSSQMVCKCRVINTTFHQQVLPFLRFRQIVQTQHFSYCPKYVESDRTIDFTMQLVFPSWLISRTVHFGLQLKYMWSTGAYSFSPMVIGASRFVNSDLSPAFLAIRNAQVELNGAGWQASKVCIINLKAALEDLFNNGAASPFDTDCDGNNLLYVSTTSAMILHDIDTNTQTGGFTDLRGTPSRGYSRA